MMPFRETAERFMLKTERKATRSRDWLRACRLLVSISTAWRDHEYRQPARDVLETGVRREYASVACDAGRWAAHPFDSHDRLRALPWRAKPRFDGTVRDFSRIAQ
jgi:hypothetical protein